MQCGRVSELHITMRNTGTQPWTLAAGYKLGVLDNPLSLRGESRVELGQAVVIAPGGTVELGMTLAAPADEGIHVLRFQMVHELVAWFGPIITQEVTVTGPCWPAPTDCGRGNPVFLTQVETALDQLHQEHPQWFGEENFHGRQVLDDNSYRYGLTRKLRAAGIIAVVDAWAGDEIQLKTSDAFSEGYDILTSEGYVRRGSGAFMGSCAPAAF